MVGAVVDAAIEDPWAPHGWPPLPKLGQEQAELRIRPLSPVR